MEKTLPENASRTILDVVVVEAPVKDSQKRTIEEVDGHVESTPVSRPRLGYGSAHAPKTESKEVAKGKGEAKAIIASRGGKFAVNEMYMNFVSEMMYPKHVANFNHTNIDKTKLTMDRITALGYLTSPLRPAGVMERWSPYDIALFEGAIALYGKNFHTIQKYITNKTVKEVIEFYYEWKKTSHYEEWKKTYILDERDFA